MNFISGKILEEIKKILNSYDTNTHENILLKGLFKYMNSLFLLENVIFFSLNYLLINKKG